MDDGPQEPQEPLQPQAPRALEHAPVIISRTYISERVIYLLIMFLMASVCARESPDPLRFMRFLRFLPLEHRPSHTPAKTCSMSRSEPRPTQ